MKFKKKIPSYSLLILSVQNVSCAQWLYDNLPEGGGTNQSSETGQTQSDADPGKPTDNSMASGLDGGESTGKTSWMTVGTTRDDSSVSGVTEITMSDFSTTVASDGESSDETSTTKSSGDPKMDMPKTSCSGKDEVFVVDDMMNFVACPDRSLVRFVFVTKERFVGNVFLDFPLTPDWECNLDAASVHGEKIFKSWLSFSGSRTPSDATFFSHEEGVRYVTGTVDKAFLLADGWIDFTDQSLVAPINYYVDGTLVEDTYVWTGTYADGQRGSNCSNWALAQNVPDDACYDGNNNDDDSYYGEIGSTSAANSAWSRVSPKGCDSDECCLGGMSGIYDKMGLEPFECYNQYPIYCVEQGG